MKKQYSFKSRQNYIQLGDWIATNASSTSYSDNSSSMLCMLSNNCKVLNMYSYNNKNKLDLITNLNITKMTLFFIN